MLKTIPRVAIPIGKKEIAAVMSGLVAGEDESGEALAKFENELGAYLGVKNIYACNSGRTALHVALQALELKPGEEVIVPAYTCAIVFEVILRLGLKPIFVDVNPETFNINPQLITKHISSKTRAVIPIHLFGRPCEMNPIMETAEKHGLYVIEDVAQALGAEYEKAKAGTFGDLAVFSFGIGKSMTSGEGGAVAVKNRELLERIASAQTQLSKASLAWKFRVSKKILAMKVFSNTLLFSFIRSRLEESLDENEQDVLENCLSLHNRKSESESALNYTITLAKMPSLSAKIAREQLKKLDMFNEKRMMCAANLTEHLNGFRDYVELPETSSNMRNTFTRYPVKVLKGSREGLMKRLARQGIDTGKPYDYLATFFESLHLNMPNTRMLAERTVTIPNHVLLKAPDISKIADVVETELKANV